MKDTESETKFSMKLKTSLQRAQKRKLFGGMTFHITDTVDVHPQIIQNIIVSGGGEVFIMNFTILVFKTIA